jgi:hypothetical protein
MKPLLAGAALTLALTAGAYAQSAMPTQTPVPPTTVPSTLPTQTPVPSTMPNANQTPEAPANGTMPNANGTVTSGGTVAPNGTTTGSANGTVPNPDCLPGQTPLPGANCPAPGTH